MARNNDAVLSDYIKAVTNHSREEITEAFRKYMMSSGRALLELARELDIPYSGLQNMILGRKTRLAVKWIVLAKFLVDQKFLS